MIALRFGPDLRVYKRIDSKDLMKANKLIQIMEIVFWKNEKSVRSSPVVEKVFGCDEKVL